MTTLERRCFLLSRLASHRLLSPTEASALTGASRVTVHRDIAALRDMGCDILHDPTGGWRLLNWEDISDGHAALVNVLARLDRLSSHNGLLSGRGGDQHDLL